MKSGQQRPASGAPLEPGGGAEQGLGRGAVTCALRRSVRPLPLSHPRAGAPVWALRARAPGVKRGRAAAALCPLPHKAADLLRDGAGAAGRDRGERWAGGRRTVSAAPEARHPGPAGWRDCSSTLSRACCGLRRWTMPGALYCPHCRPAPGTHQPSCAQVGARRGACDLSPAPPAPAVGSRAQGARGAALCESPST